MFDRNKDGFIDLTELRKVKKYIGENAPAFCWNICVGNCKTALHLKLELFEFYLQVTTLLGAGLTNKELLNFMREADKVSC